MTFWNNRSKQEKEMEQHTKALEIAEKEKEHIDNVIEKMNERLSIQLDIAKQKAERALIEAKLKNPDAEYRRLREVEDVKGTKEKEEHKEERKARR